MATTRRESFSLIVLALTPIEAGFTTKSVISRFGGAAKRYRRSAGRLDEALEVCLSVASIKSEGGHRV